jgi:Mrp family chromosome partitioning ATPase
MIAQFMNNVAWGELDYLVIDTPPGTSDEHLSIVEALSSYPNVRAVIVTTPQVYISKLECNPLLLVACCPVRCRKGD